MIYLKKYFLLALFTLSSCTMGSGSTKIPKKVRKSPKLLYKYSMKKLKSDDPEQARILFKKLKQHFPVSMYATLSELRIADTHKKEEHFATAAAGYRDFFKDHPQHDFVLSGYVMYMIGYCNYRLGPGEFFIFPPAHEKDLTYTRNAYAIFKVFFSRYPKSIYTKKVKIYYKKSLKLLAGHELYVANYYKKLGNLKAVRGRYEYILKNYSDSEIAPGVAIKLAKLYIKKGEYTKAELLCKSILKKFPSGSSGKKALALLVELKGKRSNK